MRHPLARPSSSPETVQRRSFFNRLKVGAAALMLGGVAQAQVKTSGGAKFEPARHEKDDWLDALPGKHRLVFDTISIDGLRDSLLFANNFMIVNRNDYGLKNEDLAVVVVLRHLSTPFGFNDAMWAKYGVTMADGFVDPKTKQTPAVNALKTSFDGLATQGVQFAVCSMATRRIASKIAMANGGDAGKIFDELAANVVGNGRMVPAGIVAVARAQERGYSLVGG